MRGQICCLLIVAALASGCMMQPRQEMQNTPVPTATPETTPEPTATEEQPPASPQTSQAGQQNDNTADKKTPFSDGKIDITKAISGMIGDENGNVSIGKLLELLPKGSSEAAALAQLERMDPGSKEYQAAMQLLGTLSYQVTNYDFETNIVTVQISMDQSVLPAAAQKKLREQGVPESKTYRFQFKDGKMVNAG